MDQLGLFQLVTCCRAFHWMEHTRVLAALDARVAPRGGLALLSDGSFWTGKEDWQQAAREVVQKYLGRERRAGAGRYRISSKPWQQTLAESPFHHVRQFEVEVSRSWDCESITGYLFSTSFASPQLFGERVSLFRQDLKDILFALQPHGKFSEAAVFSVILASRTPA